MTEIADEFIAGLSIIRPRVAAIDIPAGAFDPAGDWTQTYAVLASDGGESTGRVTINRASTAGGVTLDVDWRKGAGGANHWRLAGSLRTSADLPSPLISWKSEGSRHAGFFDAPGDAISATQVSRSGTIANNKLVFAAAASGRRQVIDLPDHAIANWQLIDVVQRLPREKRSPLMFTLIEQFELFKPQQSLTYSGRVETIIAGTPRTLHGYTLTGFGTVPWFYWVDETSNRLIAATSGLEAFVLGALPRGGGTERAAKRKKKAANAY